MSLKVEYPTIKHKGIILYLEKYSFPTPEEKVSSETLYDSGDETEDDEEFILEYDDKGNPKSKDGKKDQGVKISLLTEWKDRPTFGELLLEDEQHNHQAFVKIEGKRKIYIDSRDYRDFLDRFVGRDHLLNVGLLSKEKETWKDKQITLPDKLFVDLYECLKDSTNECNKGAFIQMIEYHPSLVRHIDVMQAMANIANLFILKAMLQVWPVSAYLPIKGYNGITTDDRIYPYHYAKWRYMTLKDPSLVIILRRLKELTPAKYRRDLDNEKMRKIAQIPHNGTPLMPVPDKEYFKIRNVSNDNNSSKRNNKNQNRTKSEVQNQNRTKREVPRSNGKNRI